MSARDAIFQRSIERQIALNQARSPAQRFDALCELLDMARSMAPAGPEAQRRRRLASVEARAEKERWREQCRRLLAAQRTDA